MLNLFQYSFVVNALVAGSIVAIIAPLIGIFLVLRRYSLIADTLAHVSLAGVAAGLLIGINPMYTAVATTVVASLGIERLRATRRIYGESALALFLSGSLAVATILISMGHGLSANVMNYLFGSIVTVALSDIYVIGTLAAVVAVVIALIYKELVYTSFDEDAAQVSGIPVQRINTILIVLSAVTVALAIPIVGVLLIAALIVIPVVAALQLRMSFLTTLAAAECISLASVITGIILSFYLNIATGGTIVLIMLGVLMGIIAMRKV